MKYTWVSATVDQVISPNPGYIGCVIITSSTPSKRADCTLYDGESTADPKIHTIRTAAGATMVVRFQPPLKTQRGLYLDVGSDVDTVLIQHSWGPE